MLEGILISIVAVYAISWVILKAVYWFDDRQAKQYREQRRLRHLVKFGREKSDQEILEEGRADILHGWD